MATTSTYLPIDIGVAPNDGSGDNIRDAFNKVNANFSNLYEWAFGPSGSAVGLKFQNLRDAPSGYSTSSYKVGNGPIIVGANNAGNALQYWELYGTDGVVVTADPAVKVAKIGLSGVVGYTGSQGAGYFGSVGYTGSSGGGGGGTGYTGSIGYTGSAPESLLADVSFLQTQYSSLTNTVSNFMASISYVNTVVADSTSSLAQSVQQLQTSYNTLSNTVTSAVITYVDTAVSNSTGSFAERILTLETNYSSISTSTSTAASISYVDTAVSNSTSSLAQSVVQLQASYNSLTNTVSNAVITYVNQVVVDSTSSVASSIGNLTSTVGTLSTTVTTIASTVNGITGRWGVTINNNGYVSGIELLSGEGTTSQFTVDATKFVVTGTGLTLGLSPFTITGGAITWGGSLAVGSVTTATLAPGTVSADKLVSSQLSSMFATIGTFQTTSTGQRTVITDSKIEVYDSSTLRVRIGIW